MCPNTATALLRDRQNARCTLRRIAGDVVHGSAHQGHLRVRNSNATTLVPPALPVVIHNGGEPARGGGATYGYADNTRKLRTKAIQRVLKHLKAIREVPGHWRGSKEAGGALAAETLAGSEDDNGDKAA